jgi:hypothetical protein
MGLGRHRDYEATVETISVRFYWVHLRQRVASFIAECLHCLVSKGPHWIPRPLGSEIHGQQPNEVLHAGFFDMGEVPRHAFHRYRYILLLQDDLSKFCELVWTSSAWADVMATSLVQWCVRFGSPKFLVSDFGSSFKNQLLFHICRLLGVKHHINTPTLHWSNGTVERAGVAPCDPYVDLFAPNFVFNRTIGLELSTWFSL